MYPKPFANGFLSVIRRLLQLWVSCSTIYPRVPISEENRSRSGDNFMLAIDGVDLVLVNGNAFCLFALCHNKNIA